jgi:hypothetical protein
MDNIKENYFLRVKYGSLLYLIFSPVFLIVLPILFHSFQCLIYGIIIQLVIILFVVWQWEKLEKDIQRVLYALLIVFPLIAIIFGQLAFQPNLLILGLLGLGLAGRYYIRNWDKVKIVFERR